VVIKDPMIIMHGGRMKITVSEEKETDQ